jgi:hypothetical protein
MSMVVTRAYGWTGFGLVPDLAVRCGVRRLLLRRLDAVGAPADFALSRAGGAGGVR